MSHRRFNTSGSLTCMLMIVLYGLNTLWSTTPKKPANILLVNSNADDSSLACDGAPANCTLRSAIELANVLGGPETIIFEADISIDIGMPLPALVDAGTVISGGEHTVKINGNNSASSILVIDGADIRVQRLHLFGATAATISVGGGSSNVLIDSNVIGDDDAAEGGCGQSPLAMVGVLVTTVAPAPAQPGYNVRIQNNRVECLSNDASVGIDVQGASAIEILDNVIVLNGESGARLSQNTSLARVFKNRIARNNRHGVVIAGTATANQVQDNWIGLAEDGSTAAPNGVNGILITDLANNNTIFDNTISGNGNDGIQISYSGMGNGPGANTIDFNSIGGNVSRTAYVPNGASGIAIVDSAQNTMHENFIAGNAGDGITIFGNRAFSNSIVSLMIGNRANGVLLGGGAHDNTIGETSGGNQAAVPRTQLSGNGGSGLVVNDGFSTTLAAAWIQGNTLPGIRLTGSTRDTLITGTRIFGNNGAGILVTDTATANSWRGLSVHGNSGMGIDLAGNNLIDGPVATLMQYTAATREMTGTTTGGQPGVVDVYRVDTPASGEGATFIGRVTTNGGGTWTLTETFVSTSRPLALCYVAVLHTATGSREFGPPGGPGCAR